MAEPLLLVYAAFAVIFVLLGAMLDDNDK